jgi:hypothetical protein
VTPLTPEAAPQNLDAEEHVLGAILLDADRAFAQLDGLAAADFYRASHGAVYRVAREMHDLREPVDVLTLSDGLARRGLLDEAGGKIRLRELAALVLPVGNVGHYARIVREKAAEREAARLLAGGVTVESCRAAADALSRIPGSAGGFPGLTHAELLASTFDPPRLLVDGLIEQGTLGLIVGLPESFKSWLALALAFRVAAGGGEVLGRDVATSGPVGVWLQDGNKGRAAWRAREYARLHDLPEGLPIRWHLAEGLSLPRDLAALRAEIDAEGQVLVVLDTLYTLLDPGTRLREEDAAEVLAGLKTEIADATGCTVAVVDHAPWPSDGNRGQRRPFGSVFKAALARWTLHLERDDEGGVWVAARGNDLDGFRERFVFDRDRLELHLDEEAAEAERDLADRIAEHLAESGPTVAADIARAVRKARPAVEAILEADPRFVRTRPLPGMKPNAKPWKISDVPVPDPQTGTDRQGPDILAASLFADPSPP